MNTKCLLKQFSKYVYYAGAGNCWYENLFKETFIYRVYSVCSFSVYVTMIFLENIAALIGNFPEVEKNSAVMFSAIHDIVLVKMFLLLYHKTSIRKLNYEVSTVGKHFEDKEVMKRQHRKAKVGISLYVISVYLSLAAYGIESGRKMLVEGVPFYTVVTYLPYYGDQSTFASILRVFFYITWLYMMLPMMSADCFPIVHLIVLSFKFETLCRHFEKIKHEFEENVMVNKRYAESKLKKDFLDGIVMHQKLLSLANEIDRIFGVIMALQVCESSAVAVLLLLRLALSPHMDLTNAFMTYTFVGSLFLLLALNLWNAGELTHQASLLPSAMFNCGWYLCEVEEPSHEDIRRLVLFGSACAQRPLILKAFGVQELSYETFVAVAKTTYSVFAVFYQRGE